MIFVPHLGLIQMYQATHMFFMCEKSVFVAVLLDLICSQLASVILKQYVETHWCAQSEKFRPPETTERVKTVACFIYLEI
jgi:hypothetical protein